MSRRRLNLTLDSDTYAKAEAMAARLGFCTACRMGAALIRMVVEGVPREDIERAESETEGAFMDFDDFMIFSDWERTEGNRTNIRTRQ